MLKRSSYLIDHLSFHVSCASYMSIVAHLIDPFLPMHSDTSIQAKVASFAENATSVSEVRTYSLSTLAVGNVLTMLRI